jgi:hypothetical protein
MLKEKMDIARWLRNTASIGENANPRLNPARTKP